MGFAIPIEYAMSHVETLEAGKEIDWPLFGITMINATDVVNLYRENIQIDKNIKEGVVILECAAGTGAEKSDLKRGDVIIKINENKINDLIIENKLLTGKACFRVVGRIKFNIKLILKDME